jgi:hypothetical protein
LGVLCEGASNFPTLLLLKILILTCLNHTKLNLHFLFALNVGTIYLFYFLVLVKGVRNDKGNKVIVND